ncbi:MAG: AAA family ATPase, partial [Ignavibacteriae bacterium]|nr:AAA family ATPase [Ignavibacteriota bacterium]
MKVKSIKIKNFKSVKEVTLELRNINILIGSNGVGKSNFIQFFNLLNNIVSQNLQNYVTEKGGADSLLFFGRKHSESFIGDISFGINEYEFELKPTSDNNFYFDKEITAYHNKKYGSMSQRDLSKGNNETNLIKEYEKNKKRNVVYYILRAMISWRVYHFHDTSSNSKIKQESDINDNRIFRRDASNLAAFLYLLQEKYFDYFKRIENTIKLIAPFFDKFQLEPLALNNEKIRLEWKHINSDQYFNANHFSDGTLRMICLITLLLQPDQPDTIIIDEPELGLHPSAIQQLAALIKSVADDGKQIICSTQSVTLLNQFNPEDIIVVDREDNESKFKRLDEERLEDWLDKYAIGELWEK